MALPTPRFDGIYVLHSTRPPQTIVALVKHLEAENNELQSLEMFSPSLEDVFIELTGRRLANNEGAIDSEEYLDAYKNSHPPGAAQPRVHFFQPGFPSRLPVLFHHVVFGKGKSETIAYVLGAVLTITVMGSFWGLSVQLVIFREQGILRRFRLTPVGAGAHSGIQHPLELFSDLPDGCDRIPDLPFGLRNADLGKFLVRLPAGHRGPAAFSSFGLIVASVTNTMQETQVINN